MLTILEMNFSDDLAWCMVLQLN